MWHHVSSYMVPHVMHDSIPQTTKEHGGGGPSPDWWEEGQAGTEFPKEPF